MVDLCLPLMTVANCFGRISLIRTGVAIGQIYNGSAGNSLSTSSVPFLPKAGLELILKDPLLIWVVLILWLVFVGVWGEGGHTAGSGGRSLVFIRFHIVTLKRVMISKEGSLGVLFKPWLWRP